MLGSKKLLLVLDDFWSDTEDFVAQWENFVGCLSSCLPESKILLTTQSTNVAGQASLAGVTNVEPYYLPKLEDGQILKLFMHYAWPSNSNFQKEEFETIGRKIVVKLKGDPGAAKLVGHQLSEKLDLKHWEEVAEKDWSGDNMKARIWSYQQLPLDLQRCFAFCSLFPKGLGLPKQFLINMWMAEGFIKSKDEQERLEDISENYLHELVSRFFLEPVAMDRTGIHYQLHDLLLDLAERVQGDDFIKIASTNSREVSSQISHMLSRSENIRHILLPSRKITELKEKLCLMKNIRTFCVQPDGAFVPKKVLEEILKHLKKLRVLFLPRCVDDLPDCIGNLKHLRFLEIYGSPPLKELPDSMCKLYLLQMLVLPKCESLPKNFSELISLRCIKTNRDTMSHISDVGRLTSLQGLDLFVVRKKCGNELHQLENLNQLRGKLSITGLQNVASTEDAIRANMKNKKHLETLEFEWNRYSYLRNTDNFTGLSTQHVQLLDALRPHPLISDLTIKGFGGDGLPNWLLSQNSLKHLRSLTLMNCDNVKEIPSIDESIPNCNSLLLYQLEYLKKIPSLPPNLTYLCIAHLPQLSYFSEDDLLKKEERKKSILEAVKQIAECCPKIDIKFELIFRPFFLFVKERLEAASEICITSSQYGNDFLEIVKFDPLHGGYSRDQLLNAWVLCMNNHIGTMFNKNEQSKLILPSSLIFLKISSCTITSDALTTSIQFLVSLSVLELSDIQTITSLPPKEILCSLKNLRSLTIDHCHLLSSLGGIGAVTSLKKLELKLCLNLNPSNEPLPSSLEDLNFCGCSNIDVTCAIDVGNLSRLEKLSIKGWGGRLEGLNSLTTLHSLSVMHCPGINPSSPMYKYTFELHDTTVDNLFLLKLMLSDESISSIKHLAMFNFQGSSSDDEVFQSLTSLMQLSFYNCNATHLPKNLKNLASLLYMVLNNCPNLCELELEDLPRNLRHLHFKDCQTLTEKFNNTGPYWVRFYEGSTIVTFLTEEEGNRF